MTGEALFLPGSGLHLVSPAAGSGLALGEGDSRDAAVGSPGGREPFLLSEVFAEAACFALSLVKVLADAFPPAEPLFPPASIGSDGDDDDVTPLPSPPPPPPSRDDDTALESFRP